MADFAHGLGWTGHDEALDALGDSADGLPVVVLCSSLAPRTARGSMANSPELPIHQKPVTEATEVT